MHTKASGAVLARGRRRAREGLARLGLPAAIAPTVVTDAQKQEVRNKRARPDASDGVTQCGPSGGGVT